MIATRRLRTMAASGALLGLAACAIGPDYHRPEAPAPQAFKELDGWKPAAPLAAASDSAWWSVFQDPVLDALERQVAISNESLKASEAAYRQALALTEEARAGYFPTVGASLGGQRSRTNLANGSAVDANAVSAALSASWAPDVWGKVRRSVEAAGDTAQESAANLAAARLSLQGTLATDYFLLRVDDNLKSVYEETVKAYDATLEITRNQFEYGTAAETDVITAETQLLGARAQLEGVGVQRAQLEHAIAVLIGKPPADLSIAPAVLKDEVPVVPAGLPSALLERRPDIAAAERAAGAASAQIGVAIGAYYPSITLAASVGDASTSLAHLFNAASRVWSLGPQVAETVFDGGLRGAQVSAARALYDSSVATYRQTVLTAFAQVEDQLAALRILESQAVIQKKAVQSAHEAVRLTINQYEAGTVAYTNVVTVQAIALADEQNLLNNLSSRLTASVALITALGGGWDAAALATSGAAPDVSATP